VADSVKSCHFDRFTIPDGNFRNSYGFDLDLVVSNQVGMVFSNQVGMVFFKPSRYGFFKPSRYGFERLDRELERALAGI